MTMLKLAVFAVASFVSLATSFASNFHDHLPVVAGYDDYVYAFRNAGLPLDSSPFVNVVATPTSYRNAGGVVIDIFGEDVAATLLALLPQASTSPKSKDLEDQLQARFGLLSLSQVAELLAKALIEKSKPATPELVKRSFFDMTVLNKHNRESYMDIGWSVRQVANEVLFQSPKGILPLFESFFRRTPLEDRRTISLEASIQLFTDSVRGPQLAALRQLAAKHGTKLEWFAGVKRGLLTTVGDADFQKQMAVIQSLVKSKAIDGIDITGSIFEDRPSEMNLPAEAVERAQLRLLALCRALGDKENGIAQLRIHSFEASNQGDYYKILYGGLELIKPGIDAVPFEIRIGHIAHLAETDIQRFKQIQEGSGINLFFEVNIYSNEELQKINVLDLTRTVNSLSRNHLNFALGADGAGMFGRRAQMTDMLKTLEASGLVPAATHTILRNANSCSSLFR